MKIKIICVGKLKEKYWQDGVSEYLKRLSSYADTEIIELKEFKQRGDGPGAEAEVIKEEGEKILAALEKYERSGAYIVSLEIAGKRLSSEGLAEKIKTLSLEGKRELVFIIGGSLGLSSNVSKTADLQLSFSDMTFPHQMMRLILLEQIYRSFKIIKGETYHK